MHRENFLTPWDRFHVCAVVGAGFRAALNSRGQVWASGNNENGELGLGYASGANNPVLPSKVHGLPAIVDIAVGSKFCAADDQFGKVWVWGKNDYGQLGLGDKKRRLLPNKIKTIRGATNISAGARHLIIYTKRAEK